MTGTERDWSQDEIDEDMFRDDGDDGEQDINCGLMANGRCGLAGTEWCDWDCPRAGEASHNRKVQRVKPAPLFDRGEGER
jgi:hypothetical protein